MHATDFGLTLIIANPAAQSGAAREVAERLQRFLDMTARASQFDLMLTERMGHALSLIHISRGRRGADWRHHRQQHLEPRPPQKA